MICQCPATIQLFPKTITLWKQRWATKIFQMKVLSISKLIRQPLISNEWTQTVIAIQGSRQHPNKASQALNARIISNSNRCSTYKSHTWKITYSPLNQRVLLAMMSFLITVQAWTWIRLLMLVKAGILSSSIHRKSNCRHQWVHDRNQSIQPIRSQSSQPIKSSKEWHRPLKLSKTHMNPSNTSKPNK